MGSTASVINVFKMASFGNISIDHISILVHPLVRFLDFLVPGFRERAFASQFLIKYIIRRGILKMMWKIHKLISFYHEAGNHQHCGETQKRYSYPCKRNDLLLPATFAVWASNAGKKISEKISTMSHGQVYSNLIVNMHDRCADYRIL